MSEHRLSEIVIERPRHGMRCSSRRLKGTKKALNRLTAEARDDGLLSPYLIKVRQGTKELSDHLGPLRRLLYSKVGQPWDLVYSELCQRLEPKTMAGQHVVSHLWDYVERYVEIIDEVPYRKATAFYRQRQLGDRYRDEFYVHPETGILCVAKKAAQTPRKIRNDFFVIDAYHHYRKLNEVWYLIALQDLEPGLVAWDVVLKREMTPENAQKEYGKLVYAASKKQCNKRELKFIRSQLEDISSTVSG